MILFVDSSCLIRLVTRDGPPLEEWEQAESIFASRLARLEVARTLNRLRIEVKLSAEAVGTMERAFDQVASRIGWLLLDEPTLEAAARPTPFHIKSLDAIHLATARLLRDAATPDLAFATHDRALGLAGMAMGFNVVGV